MSFKHQFLALIISLVVILLCFGIEIIVLYITRDYYFLILCVIWFLMFVANYIWIIFLKEPDKKKRKKKEDD